MRTRFVNRMMLFYYFVKFLIFREDAGSDGKYCVICKYNNKISDHSEYRYCHADEDSGPLTREFNFNRYYMPLSSVPTRNLVPIANYGVHLSRIIAVRELAKFIVTTNKYRYLFTNLDYFGIYSDFVNNDSYVFNVNGSCPLFDMTDEEPKKPEKKKRK